MIVSDKSRNLYKLKGKLAKRGYDWWWHSFTGQSVKTGEERAFFIEYFVVNPALGGTAPVFGQDGKRQKPSYCMIKAGTWGKNKKQIHRFFPIAELHIKPDELDVCAGDCRLTETMMKGRVAVSEAEAQRHPEYLCDSGTMEWELSIHKIIPYNVGFGASRFFQKLNAFEMFWHAEGMKTEYSGRVVFDGEEFAVTKEACYGYADKNWGRDFTSPWVWLNSCNMVSRTSGKKLRNSVFDIGGGCPKVFGIALKRKLLFSLYYEGREYEFNFTKIFSGSTIQFKCTEEEHHIRWEIKAKSRQAYVEMVCECKKEDMIFINYEAPDGVKRHNRLWNGGNGTGQFSLYEIHRGHKVLVDVVDFYNTGCEYGEYGKQPAGGIE